MKILAVGGGSGGHVTPVAAVLNEVAARSDIDSLEVVFVCDTAFEKQSRGIMKNLSFPVRVVTIPSGKLRRYAHFSWWDYVRHFSIVLQNIRDIVNIAAGFFASIRLLKKEKPAVVFAKGGYVCLPMGLAAHVLRIPLVLHDSDARPGLTNKVLARYASAIGTGMPLENYHYDASISHYVGVPINTQVQKVNEAMQRAYRDELDLPADKKLVVSVGGGLGSQVINDAMINAAMSAPDDSILFYNVTGEKHYDAVAAKTADLENYMAVPFVYNNMHKLLGAADIVVSRASATTLQELAGLGKAVIAVPARQLGDQIKNAELFAEKKLVVVLSDDSLSSDLGQTIQWLMREPKERAQLARRLHEFARPHAARDMAEIIVRAGKDQS